MKYCSTCGNQLNDNAKFCMVCGAKQPDASSDRGGIEVIPTAEEPNNKKKKIILISSIIGAAVVMILAGVICLMFLFGKKGSDPEPTTTEVTTTEKATTEKSTTEKTTTEEPTTEDPVELENIAAIEAYHDVISGIVSGAVTYSSDRIACINENDSSEYLVYNNYAIDDFDSDGVAEMMLYMECNASSSPMASSAAYGSRFEFYEYNANRDSAELIHNVNGCCEVNSGDSLIFYNNGVIEIEDQQFATDNDGGIFLCVNTDIFDLIESGYDYDDDLEYNEDGESWAYLIYIYKLDDVTYSMQFVDNISTPYVYDLSETEGKELLDKLRDTGTINAEVNDFNLEDLADVCGFDYDEAVAEIEANTPAVDYEAMYGEVIEKYIQLINDGLSESQILDENYPYEADEWCFAWYNTSITQYSSGEIGYLISDLDGNGIPELLIGICDDSFVLDVYTIRNDKIVLIINSEDRTNLYYCGDGTFYRCFQNGDWKDFGIYQIDSGYATILEVVYAEPEDGFDSMNGMLYYYSTISIYEPENATNISLDEFWDKQSKFVDKIKNISGLTPLSEY